MLVDFHIHSTLSDGNYSLEKIISKSLEKQIQLISITDHEVMKDYSNETQIPIINGIEFNTDYFKKMHILGYNIKDVDGINEMTCSLARSNEKICLKVIELLKNDGFKISYWDVMNYCNQGEINNEYLTKKMIVKYLLYKKYITNLHEGYTLYIGKGRKYYIPINKINYIECLNIIKECGGISVLAHPFSLNYNDYELFDFLTELKHNGLNGIEIINGPNADKTSLYDNYATSLDLITTVGSDFHGNPNESLGINIEDDKVKDFIRMVGK